MNRRIVKLLLWVDYNTDGIRLRLFIAAAVVQVFLAPLWDQYLPYHRVAARMEPATLLATLVFLLVAVALLGGRVVALSTEEDAEGRLVAPRTARRAWTVVAGLAGRYLRLMRLVEPWPFFIARLGAGLSVTLLALRGASGLIRWTLWKGMRAVEELFPSLGELAMPRAALERVYFWEQALLKGVVWASIPLTLLAAWSFLRKPSRGRTPTALRDLRALAGLDPLLERREHQKHHSVYTAFQGDLVARVLRELADWETSAAVADEQSCRDDVAFYLRARGYRVDIERWIEKDGERRRVDLLIEDSIVIEMKYALQDKGAGEQDRARSQIERYAHIWGESGPVFLLLAATPRLGAERYGEFATRWNASLASHVAPVLIVADTPGVALTGKRAYASPR